MSSSEDEERQSPQHDGVEEDEDTDQHSSIPHPHTHDNDHEEGGMAEDEEEAAEEEEEQQHEEQEEEEEHHHPNPEGEEYDEEQDADEEATEEHDGEEQEEHSHSTHGEEGDEDQSSSSGVLASPLFAKVTYEYAAQKSDELSMKEGDIIIVTKKPSEGGWWFGQLATESGWFPQDFVAPIDEDEVKQFIMKQQQTAVRKATLSSSGAHPADGAGSGPGTPTLSKQAAMAEMAVLQQELKELESKRTQLQQEIHRDREQRTKYIRLAKSELASSVLPLPNGLYTPSVPIDGPASAATLSFSCDVFARDLLRCCGRLSASIDADAHIQVELAPNLMEALTQLPPELQSLNKEDKTVDRLLDALRNVTNPLMNLTANTDHVPYSTVHDLFVVLAGQLSTATKPPSAPPSAAPPPPPPTAKPSLPLSEVDATGSSEDSPGRTKSSSSSSSSKKKSKKDKSGKDKDKDKERSKEKKKSAVS